jgi:mono/diheme cytochrome c family protein
MTNLCRPIAAVQRFTRGIARPTVLRGLLPLLLIAADISWAGDVFNGRDVYRSHCASCHGTNGAGEIGNAPDFTIGEGLLQLDTTLLRSIANGKGVMPGYRGILSDEDILDVISYIRALL